MNKTTNKFLLIAIGLPLTPKQQGIFSRFLLRTFTVIFILVNINLDLLDLEPEDDCPDKTQDHSWIAVNNVLSTNIF